MYAQLDDPEKKKVLKENPKNWVASCLNHPIDPSKHYNFKTEDGEPLTHLLDEKSWLHPDQWADINILLLARGELKSTSTGWLATWAHDVFPQFHTYYIAPSKGQVYDYIEPIRSTYVEQANMESRRKTNNKSTQVFKTYQKDENGDVNPVLGRFQTDSGYSEESVRGKHSQMGIADEIQDLSKRVFNVFLPAIDMGLPDEDWAPVVFGIGTPKETGSLYHDLWERSDKRTWDAESQEWIIQDEVDPYTLSAEEVQDLPGNVELDEDDEYTVHAWHVDWINSPLHSDADVARAKKQMGPMEFENEVLAKFFDPEDNLLNEQDVRSCLSKDYNFRESPYSEDNTVCVFADWGGGSDKNASDTIFAAAEEIEYEDGTSEYVVLNIEFVDTELTKPEETKKYEEWLIRYDADVGVTDYGYGQDPMERLQNGNDTIQPDGHMDTVSAAKYGNVADRTDIKWTEDEDGNKIFFTCDKSRSVTRMVESFRDEKWVIPQSDRDSSGLSFSSSESDGVRFINQLTAPYKTLSEGTKTGNKSVVIETSGNQRDDSFDVMTYGWLAFNEVSEDDESVIAFDAKSRH